ncbi:aminoglycoside phosphotransferase family protein [Actinomadura barringtoniae]|uniref:aminoglycoside phosphotransferase family protein n=1 Tax=Actinomadura barringtoniae TaxID=1427535 RepID=UPI0027DB42E3|nr:aminoglycoside phosphotransferase family protein [Actinomadura barringtoniae]
MIDVEVPAELAGFAVKHNGDKGRAWIERLPGLLADRMEGWGLRPEGPARNGMAAIVVPVVRVDGERAVLKLQILDEESEGEPAGLRAWNGNGAVLLLEDDEATGAMLLERLDPDRSLDDVEDATKALQILAELLERLVALPAPEGIRRLEDIANAMLTQVPDALEVLDGGAKRVVDTSAALIRELVSEPGDRLLHWDLHYENVLAGEREPWLAIDPNPLAGDPGFDLLPALDNRWEDITATGDVARAVRARFDLMVEVLGLDRRRAAGWTYARVLQNTLWDLEDGEPGMHEMQLAIAEALAVYL